MTAIRELRTLARLTQFEAAKKSGLDRTRLSLAECGHVLLRPDQDAALRKALIEAIEGRASQLKGVLSVAQREARNAREQLLQA
jgi:transcriptional regulator with XRE-family HTH domain